MTLEEDLRAETEKWLIRAEEALEKMSPQASGDKGGEGQRFMTNIQAYVSDSYHFLEKGDLIRAFEAVVWAWAWMEIGQEVGILVQEEGE